MKNIQTSMDISQRINNEITQENEQLKTNTTRLMAEVEELHKENTKVIAERESLLLAITVLSTNKTNDTLADRTVTTTTPTTASTTHSLFIICFISQQYFNWNIYLVASSL